MQHVARSPARPWFARPVELIGPYQPSLLESLAPSLPFLGKVLVSLAFVGLLMGASRAYFFLPGNPVPITLQTGAVLLTGGILGFRWGLVSILIWYFLGMAGVPAFAKGANGWAFLSGGITAGYIIGFIGASAFVGFLSQRGWVRSKGLWAMLLGNLLIYLPALLWLHYKDFGWPKEGELFKSAMYPFMAGDLVKLMAASLVATGLWAIVDRRKQAR
ncbi:MAG: biotin transporter BioY [Dehalococcoidia bacterium]|nr:biotin transporter BioY [Dehalococcoidia bacterium]